VQPTTYATTPDLSLVVPTYNERSGIADLTAATFDAFRAAGITGELIIVDDNSPDGTGAEADRLSDRYALRVVHRPAKLGLGSAVMEGFQAASAPILGVMDADFSHPPEVLPRLLSMLRDLHVDAVVGSRYVPGGTARNWPLRRHAMSRLACLLARPLTPVRDATSGLFLIRRDAVTGAPVRAGGFKICLELLLRGQVRSVAEVPYDFLDRTRGASKMTLREGVNYLTQLFRLYTLKLSGGCPRPRYVRAPAR
jgi:dolichol-phosphate mannosyltransferase